MQALIDGDCLVYEVASVGQYIDEETGEEVLRPWSWVEETLDGKIRDICNAVGSSQKPILYLTGDEYLWKLKARVRPSLPIYEPNFRIGVAKLRKYKDMRRVEKPYYYNSIRAYLVVAYNAFVSIGCEADDEMAIEQTRAQAEGRETIICTRDKDLRQVAGWHYGWECGLQAEFGPTKYDNLGAIELHKSRKKIVGGGFKFFCSQLLTGDPVDTVPGLPKLGPVKAFDYLGAASTTKESLDIVQSLYKDAYDLGWKEQLREQCNLLWMVRGRSEQGTLKMFSPREYADG